MIFKIFIYVFAIFVVQTGIVFEECRGDSQVMAWLIYEVVAFYMNVIAMSFFLLFSSCKKYKSIRDRIGLAGDLRSKVDFLEYCKQDIHWFCIWFTQIMLSLLALIMRTKNHSGIQWAVGNLFTRQILEVFILRQVYFNSKFEIKSYVKLFCMSVFLINVYMLKLFFSMETQTWFGPIYLQDIVLHFFVFL